MNEPIQLPSPATIATANMQVVTRNIWDPGVEGFIRELEASSSELSQKHDEAGKAMKSKDAFFALPPTLIPLIMAPVSAVAADYFWIKYLNASMFALSAMMAGIARFYNFGKKSEKHFNHSGKYADLVTDIREELSKPQSRRREPDVFMSLIRCRYDNICGQAPVL